MKKGMHSLLSAKFAVGADAPTWWFRSESRGSLIRR
jgi:hypothetical protein